MSGNRDNDDGMSLDDRRVEERRSHEDRRMAVLEDTPFDMSFEVDRRFRERRVMQRRSRRLDA